jgi:hypothetical protein
MREVGRNTTEDKRLGKLCEVATIILKLILI